jgi:hypothetical protein
MMLLAPQDGKRLEPLTQDVRVQLVDWVRQLLALSGMAYMLFSPSYGQEQGTQSPASAALCGKLSRTRSTLVSSGVIPLEAPTVFSAFERGVRTAI